MGRLKPDDLIKRFYLIKRLAEQGHSIYRIIQITGSGSETVKKYLAMDAPPDYYPLNHLAAVRRARARDLAGNPLRRSAKHVPSIGCLPEIAALRKGLYQAFMDGNLELHTNLTQALKIKLAEAKAAVKQRDEVPPLLLEAAE